VSGTHVESCGADTAGTYTLAFADAQGLTATATLVVGAATNAQGCGVTDVGCWLSQVVGAVESIAGQVVGGLYAVFFSSPTGRNYVDVSNVFQLPAIACRSGEFPTHPDGVHCLPFPFAVVGDVAAIAAVLDVTPVPPTVPARLHAPPIDYSFTIDPTVVLTPTVMTWVKAVEYVAFITGLALGTYRFVQSAGAE
jgi:hypothetical protein